MKDSGVEWIGKIPEHWYIERLQWHISEIKESNKPEKTKQVLSLTNKRGVIPYEEKGALGNVAKEDYSQYKIAYPSTIVANSMNILIGSVGRCDYFGCVSPVYYVYKPNAGENLDFINYMFQMEQFQKELRRYANGILEIRLRVSSDGILKRKMAFPPIPEQEQIVHFLDNKCSQIDALIANTGTQIAKLKQYKQSLITEAVTKGLDPTVPMKDSGVEWIGKIPESWSVRKFKFATTIHEEKYTSGNYQYIALENIESFSGKYIHSDSIYDLVGSKIANTGDVIFGKLRPYLGKVFEITEKVCVSNEFAIFHGKLVNSHYLKYYMINSCFVNHVTSSTYGTKMPRAHINFISSCFITVPSPTEQEQIVHFLDSKCSQIDRLIEVKQSKIEKLEEYKKSLIYEYVTGKKEVEHG